MNRTSSHSQAHLQFAQANAKAKNCKRACLSANAFCRPEKQNWDSDELKMKQLEMKEKKAQQVTRNIKNWA